MSKEFAVLDIPMIADATITTGQILKVTSTGVDVSTAATDKIIGIAMTDAASGEMVTVRVDGVARVQASTSISIGAWLTATTAGQAVTTTTDKNVVLGVALEAATAQNDFIAVKIGVFTLSVA